MQSFTSSNARYQVFTEFSSRVDGVLAGSENNLNTSIQKFFNAVAEVAASPGSLPERQVLLGEAFESGGSTAELQSTAAGS